jgi:hypothetical protein
MLAAAALTMTTPGTKQISKTQKHKSEKLTSRQPPRRAD